LEENSTVKHEYIDGHVYAMAGGTVDHGDIAVNVVAALRPLLRGGPCRVHNSDVKVRLGPRRFVYPDVSVSCDGRDRANGRATFIAHPRLVIEVLSPTTADYDRGDKFEMYRAVEALEEYVLISADREAVEVRTRQANGAWQRTTFGPGEEIVLSTIAVTLPIAVIYEDVDLT
jgi:Uma2 family endonuclease